MNMMISYQELVRTFLKIGNHLKTIVTSYLLSDLGINNIIIEKYQAQTIQE